MKRYVLLAWPLGILAFANGYRFLHFHLKNSNSRIASGVLIFSGIVFSGIVPFYDYPKPQNWDQRVLLNWAAKEATKKDLIVTICIPAPDDHCFSNAERTKGADVYFKSDIYDFDIKNELASVQIFKVFQNHIAIDRMIVLIERVIGRDPIIFKDYGLENSEFVHIYELNQEAAIIFSGGLTNVRSSWFRFLDKISSTPAAENFAILELLLQKAIIEKNYSDYAKYFGKWHKHPLAEVRAGQDQRKIYQHVAEEVFKNELDVSN